MLTQRFEIGLEYIDRKGRTCTVTDVLRTYNSAGELVRIRYVAQHTFLGQTVTDSDVLDTTIARALGATVCALKAVARHEANK